MDKNGGRFFIYSEPAYSKQAYVPLDPPVIGQEYHAIGSALHDLGQFVPLNFFTPGFVFVLKNCLMVEVGGKKTIQRYIDRPGVETIYAYYVPLEIQAEWFLGWRRDNIAGGSIIANAVEKYLSDNFEKYVEVAHG